MDVFIGFLRAAVLGAVIAAATAAPTLASARIVIINDNAAGVGLNDPTPAAPVGGNPGTTVGQQRLLAFQRAAEIWGATLDSPVEVRILAAFLPLTCTATTAVLGGAGATNVFLATNPQPNGLFPGLTFTNTWYPSALADKVLGTDMAPAAADIQAVFNSNIGQPGCLPSRGWYTGFDGNEGSDLDLVAVLVHELAHGLGYQQFASVTTGALLGGHPDVFNRNIFDNTLHKRWADMTNTERLLSGRNPRRVVFDGREVTAAVPDVLQPGTPLLRVTSPALVADIYSVGEAAFGPSLAAATIAGVIVQARDPSNAAGPSILDGCSPLTNAAEVAGKIALIDRGTCGFPVKVANAQAAGAIAAVIVDNVPGGPPAGLGGSDPAVTIPSVRIMQQDGIRIKSALALGVSAILGVDLSVRAGADEFGRALLYTPNPVEIGSSVSHWDSIATPNQLMEPAFQADLTHEVKPPVDLTLPALRDIGWFPDADVDGLEDSRDACPTASDQRATVVVGGTDTGVANVVFSNGCSIADLVARAADGATNHGRFVSAVAELTNDLRKGEIITNEDKAAIQSAAAASR